MTRAITLIALGAAGAMTYKTVRDNSKKITRSLNKFVKTNKKAFGFLRSNM